ncbi:MAG: hypothetical protein ABEH40_08700 [Haloferacaceae archaeon]
MLVFDRGGDPEARRTAAALLGRPEDRSLRVLGVGIGRRADALADGYRERARDDDLLALVNVGAVGPNPRGAHVADVTDLTGIGIRMTTALRRWDRGAVRACVDSLSPLLGQVSFERAYRFVDVMTSRIARVGASHWHVDPRAHDDRTLHRLMSAFDAVVREDGGEWTVRA